MLGLGHEIVVSTPQPITNLQALQTESIVPSQFHRRENGSPGEVRKVNIWDSGPPEFSVRSQPFRAPDHPPGAFNWSKFAVASRL